MRDSKVLRFFIGILVLILIIAYPIGKILTDPVRVNTIFDKINFEQKFITIFTEISVKQLSVSTGQSAEELSETIAKELISEEELKLQRVNNIENFYNDISLNKVPQIKFEIQNPVSAIKQKFSDTATGIVDDVKNFELCPEGKENWLCDLYNSLIQNDESSNSDEISINPEEILESTDVDKEMFPNYTLETTLGINENNISQINQIYRILRYGPDVLLAIIGILAFIGYLTTFPSTKYSFGLFIDIVKADIFALIIWVIVPFGFKILSPIKIVSGDTSLTPYINDAVGSIFFEIAKVALLVPLILTIVTLLIWLITSQISRARKIDDEVKMKNQNRVASESEEDSQEDDDETDTEQDDEEDPNSDMDESKDNREITQQEISKADNQLDKIITQKDQGEVTDNPEVEEQE